MYKKSFLYFLISLLLTCSFCTNDTNRDIIFELKGDVKSAYTKIYKIKKVAGEWIQTEERGKDYTGIYFYNILVELDENGKLITEKDIDSEGVFQGKCVYSLREGKLMKSFYLNSRGEISYVTFHFPLNDSLETSVGMYPKNIDTTGAYNFITKNDNDTTGISKFFTAPNIKKVHRKNKRSIIAAGYSSFHKREFDKNGNMISMKYLKNYPTDKIYSFSQKEPEFIKGERYEYLEFDRHGNWTKRLIYRYSKEVDFGPDNRLELDGDPVWMAVREIEYY